MLNTPIRSRIFRVLLLFSLLTLLVTPTTVWKAAAAETTEATQAATASDTELIQEIMNYIELHNIEGVTKEELIRAAIEGMTYTLNDPYTSYYSAEQYNALEDQLQGDYIGIGISVTMVDSYLEVQEVFSNSPAAEAGIRIGDRITKVDGQVIKDGETYLKLISGEEGTTVSITVLREQLSIPFELKRREVKIDTVTSQLIDSKKGIGYMSILQFASDTDELFTEQYNRLKEQGMQSLIIDMRYNPGGFVDSAANIANHFIDKGLLMYTKNNTGMLTPFAIYDGEKSNLDVYVLMNEHSASSSEILAGALQDQKLATLIGTTSYGKGRIQSMIPLTDGGLLSITTEAYLTPNKTDFHEIGLEPDIEVKEDLAQLLTALKLAGLEEVTLTSDSDGLKLNGHVIDEELDYFQEGDKLYLTTRTLAALVQAEPSWNSSKQEAQFTLDSGRKFTFSNTMQSAVLIEGTSYVNLKEFQKSFKGITWSMKGDSLTVTAKGY